MSEILVRYKQTLRVRDLAKPNRLERRRRALNLLKGSLMVVLIVAVLALAACSSGSGSAPDESSEELTLTPTQKRALESLLSQSSTSPELARQVEIILAVAGGMDNAEVARRFGKDADEVDVNELLKQLQ